MFGVIMAIGLLAMLVLYPTYFLLLGKFQSELKRTSPELWVNARRGKFSTPIQTSYRLLTNLALLSEAGVSPSVLRYRQSCLRVLYGASVAFMVTLLSGLAEAVVAKA